MDSLLHGWQASIALAHFTMLTDDLSHLHCWMQVDARVDGGLLLELYSRDGVGTMISTDFYEGIRPALPADTDAIAALLAPLAAAGITRRRSRQEIVSSLPSFTVVEREAKVHRQSEHLEHAPGVHLRCTWVLQAAAYQHMLSMETAKCYQP